MYWTFPFIGAPTDEENTVAVSLSFLRDQLLYDVRQYAFLEGDVSQDETPDNHHRRHQTQDIGESGNKDIVTRALDTAFLECVNFILAFSRVDAEEGDTSDDRLKSTDAYTVTLNVPEKFSKTVVALLQKKIHDYMVFSALARFLAVTSPKEAEKYALMREQIEQDIKDTRFTDDADTLRPFYPAW